MAWPALSTALILRASSWLWAVIVLSTTALAPASPPQAQPAFDPSARIYDVPVQDLNSAIDDYVRISGAQVLYETFIATGRKSTGLKGRFTAEAALATLLGGTGLVALRTDVNAFVIARASPGGASHASAPQPGMDFLGALQRGVLDALCRNPRTRPGSYSVAIELWVAPDGRVQRTALIGSTGSLARDETLATVLGKVVIAMPPPPKVPQPFILTIAQRSPRETGDCVR